MVQIGEILDIGDVHALVFAEVPEVGGGVRPLVLLLLIEFAAAVVYGVGIVIGHAFAAQVVIGTSTLPGITWRRPCKPNPEKACLYSFPAPPPGLPGPSSPVAYCQRPCRRQWNHKTFD